MTSEQWNILDCLVELSSSKEREALEQSVVSTLCQLMKCELKLIKLLDSRGNYSPKEVISAEWNTKIGLTRIDPVELSEKLVAKISNYVLRLKVESPKNIYRQYGTLFWPLHSFGTCVNLILIEGDSLSSEELASISAIASLFSNFTVLLDAGVRDPLSGLFFGRVFVCVFGWSGKSNG